MQRPNVICLAIDHLQAGYLGAYGNTWISTPAIDRLAAQSFVLDRAIIDSPRLESIYRSLWLGLHVLCPKEREIERDSLPTIFSRRGWQTALLTDDATVAEHPLATGFSERLLIRSLYEELHRQSLPRPHGTDQHGEKPASIQESVEVASAAEETDAANFFAAAENWLEAASPPFFLWLHTGTLGKIWDAPLEYRRQFVDEDDPEPSVSADVPNRVLPEDFDPDELLAFTHAYAGQVSLVDQLIESMLETIDNAGLAESTVVVLFSPRGMALGEHRHVGPFHEALYAEVTHVPWMIRLPGDWARGGRSQHIVQPADWSATILDCSGIDNAWVDLKSAHGSDGEFFTAGCGHSIAPLVQGKQCGGFDRACIVTPNQQVFISPAWSFRLSGEDAAKAEHTSSKSDANQPVQHAELFVKPDDWFEVNEVSNRCPDVVESMRTALNQFTQACQMNPPAVLAKLPDELMVGQE